MKYLLVLLALPLSVPAHAVDLTCTLPTANVTRGLELCDELRLKMRIRSADWSNDLCASMFLRIGLLAGERASTRKAAQATVSTAVNDAVTAMESTWPEPTEATCGDATLDAEFGEACDDGNQVNGDGCDDSCQIEP